MVDEKKAMASSYLLNFYQDSNNLTNTYSSYRVLLIKSSGKFNGATIEDKKKGDFLNDEEKEQLAAMTENLRFYIHNCMMKVKALSATVFLENREEIKKLEEIYNKMDEVAVPNDKDIAEFVQLVNILITKDVVGTLLQNAEDYVNTIYGS